MKWTVYWQKRFTKAWKFCGGFESFVAANEHVDYLSKHLPGGKKQKFKINGTLKSFNVCELDGITT